MSNLKARLLAGTKRTEPLWVPEFETDNCGGYLDDETVNEECDGVIRVRPLSDAEMAEVTAAKVEGQVVRGKPGEKPTEQEVSIGASAVGQAKARRIAVAYGMSVNGMKWSAGEVGKLHPRAVQRIAAVVEDISGGDGLTTDARQFRGPTGGSGDGDPAPDGDAAGDDAG